MDVETKWIDAAKFFEWLKEIMRLTNLILEIWQQHCAWLSINKQ